VAELPSYAAPMTAQPLHPNLRSVKLTSLSSLISPDIANGHGHDAVTAVTLVPAGSYPRPKPFFVDLEQAAASTRGTVEMHFGILKQQHNSVRLAALEHALITGQGAVVTSGDSLIKESVIEFTAQGRAPDGFAKAESEEGTYTMPRRIDRRIEAPCLLAKRPWYRNFGHWLVDGATVVALAADRIQAENLTVVTGTFGSPKMRAVVMDTIEQLASGAAVLQHADEDIWQFDQLNYVTPPHVPPLFKLPQALRLIRAGFLGPNGGPDPYRKIFITRRTAGNRRLVNEAEIFELCAARGFEFIDPEELTIREQAILFAEASAIIGAKGAALTSCLFCHPGTKIMVLSPADFPDPFFWDVAQNDCEYAEIFGPIVTDKARGLNEFMVEAPRVAAMLDVAGL
jgi:capsular polysaccharide biosynthesis protein